MSIKNLSLRAVAVFAAACLAGNMLLANPKGDMVIWYDSKPVTEWEKPLPIGNGYIGGLVYGGVQRERIALNETNFWSGRPHDYDDPAAGAYYDQIKTLVFDRKFREAENMIDKNFYGNPVAQQCYEPLGDLRMLFYDVESLEAGDYRRSLDMETGITSVTFKARGVTYNREVFVSYPDNVMIVRLTVDKPGSVSLDAWLESFFADNVQSQPGRTVLDGQWEGPLPQYWLIAPVEGKGMKFQTVLEVRNEGGTQTVTRGRLSIRKADAVTLVLTAATSYVNYNDISADPDKRNKATMAAVAGKSFDTFRKEQVEIFSEKMGRVHLELGDTSRNAIPIDKRIEDVKAGVSDPNLEALCFQFGRYMLLSSSRKGGQPATLQAIWNERLTPPWGSKYTININIQMNYWPSEVANLAECHIPLFDMLRETSVPGAKTAETYYGVKHGWVAHHNLDIWRGTAPVDAARYGIWPVGGAWLCQHIWEHYAFSGDKEFLKEYYPVMKGSAEFLADLLVRHPQLGYLVTPFSMSPEHGFYDDNGEVAFVSPAPMMDVAIMNDLFPHVIEASKILKVDSDLRKRLEKILKSLPPYKVNSSGYPQEWVEDFKPLRGGHDVSPYFPVYPGNSILLHRESDQVMVEAYKRWMETRSVGRGGFPASWNIALWSRLERGDKASAQIRALNASMAEQFLKQGTGAQVDAPFGYTAGIAESLIQSHAGEISLLPALPEHWKKGSVSGLRARGGNTIDISWVDGKLVCATISNPAGGTFKVRHDGIVETVTIPANGSVTIGDPDKKNRYDFNGSISREILENYLDRSVTAGYFLEKGPVEGYEFPYREDDIRMVLNIGAKFIGRSIYCWGGESKLGDSEFLAYSKNMIDRLHSEDPDIIFQACLFEFVSGDVNKLEIPAWVFEAFGLPVEKRNFRSADMVKRLDPKMKIQWGGRGGSGVPMVNNLETRMWFYFLARTYIDLGCEALHLGQVELISQDDPGKEAYSQCLDMIREYARSHARRHYVLLDGHTPKGGFVKDGVSLLDFNSFPLRIKENVDKPMEGFLEVGHNDGIYLRSKGAISPSGWKAESMPYLVEFDNFGTNGRQGVADTTDHFCWGYDDITWFATQSEEYRNQWLEYAFDWLHKTDPNGHLQMCLIRMVTGKVGETSLRSYFANTRSEACPVGYSQEETIKRIWNTKL